MRLLKLKGYAKLSKTPIQHLSFIEDQNVDCLLSKVQKTDTDRGYGLLTVAGTIIPKTVGDTNEAIKSAISRLEPQFTNLLAEKWLELTVNEEDGDQ